ncbi:MAG: glutamate formiminotransferase [Actinomycetota bacterium]|nr:glutamate formiminotransferase [Actinomycetota bacterium]
MTLLAVPNVSEGRDARALAAISAGFTAVGARLLDVHADPDHHRSVFSLAGRPGMLAETLVHGAEQAVRLIDVSAHAGAHPRIGAIDVAPIVFLGDQDRGAACAEAVVAAELLASEFNLPVFFYGELADGRSRAELRRGGLGELARRMADGELAPDYGPNSLHPTAGAVLVAARPPLIAFNVELAPPASLEQAREIAARIREGGDDGLRGVRAIGLSLERQGVMQVSTNLEDFRRAGPADVVAAIRRHHAVQAAELVALAPAEAFADFPDDVPLRGFDADRQIIERALDS